MSAKYTSGVLACDTKVCGKQVHIGFFPGRKLDEVSAPKGLWSSRSRVWPSRPTFWTARDFRKAYNLTLMNGHACPALMRGEKVEAEVEL